MATWATDHEPVRSPERHRRHYEERSGLDGLGVWLFRPENLLVALFVMGLVTAILLAFSAFASWESASKMGKLSHRLGELEQFEKRITKTLGASQTHYQIIVQEMNTKVEAIANSSRTEQKRNAESFKKFEQVISRLQRMMDLAEAQYEAAPSSEGDAASDVTGSDSGPVRRSLNSSGALTSDSSLRQFRRVLRLDGSVAYEKRR